MPNPGAHKLSDVYGISRDVPMNYVPRDDVDGALVDSLTRDKHIVIFGSSKQGKTCLRKWNLKDEDYIVVTCSNQWDLGQLHSAILKQAGYTVDQSVTRTASGQNKIQAKFSGSVNLGIARVGAEVGGDDQTGVQVNSSAPRRISANETTVNAQFSERLRTPANVCSRSQDPAVFAVPG